MKRVIFPLILFLLSCPIFAQNNNNQTDAHLMGHVIDGTTGNHLPFVTIHVKGTTLGAVSDASGHYFITNLPIGEHTVSFSRVGYETQEKSLLLKTGETKEMNVVLNKESILMNQVVVSANKYETKKREASNIVNVISPKIFESTASNTVSDVLDYQTGVRVEMSCSNCGVPQLRINGLEGQYTQLLMDSRPIFSSLASVYGLEQIPAGMVDRVEVVRGGGSALYGSNAIGGVVNIITKEPVRNSLNISNNTQVIGGKAWDNNTNLNGSFVSSDSKIGVFLFGVLRQRQAYDHDADGFSEIPRLNSATLGFRSYFKISNLSKLTFEYHHVKEDRRGGNLLDRPEHEADIAESLKHKIDAGNIRWDYVSKNGRHFATTYASLQHIGRNSYFGTEKDPNAYGASDDITAVAGGQYRYHMNKCLFMPADLSAGVEYSYNRLRDQIMGYGRDLLQNVHIYGGYVQNEWKNKQVSFLVGVRAEKHSMLKNPIFSPRANVRYTPIDEIVLRASYASGYRAPQTYDEDLHVGAVGGEVSLIQLDPNLRPEKSHSVSLSADWAKRLGVWEANLTLEGFFTQLNDVFNLVENGHDEMGNLLLLRTNAKGARVAGVNFEAKFAYKQLFTFSLGYTYQQSRYVESVIWSENVNILPQRRMFRTPDHYGYFMFDIDPFEHFCINLNGKLTGPMLIQHYAGYVAEDEEVVSQTFFDMGVKISYEIPLYKLYSLEINAGVKNIFNAFQKDIDRGINRDAGYIYGPNLPRTYFFGLNFKL